MNIEVVGVSHHFRVRPVLKKVDLSVASGELVALMGPNGMGKTTLLQCMGGLLTPIRGQVFMNGQERRSTPEVELAIRRNVAYLPDKPWLPGERTGRELLFDMGSIYDVEPDRIFEHSNRLFDLFELQEKADTPIRSYSNGQTKKIAIAATLITDAECFLFDEPFTGGLDPSGIQALKAVLSQLGARSDVTVVLASQIAEIVEALAARVVVLREGEVLANGPVADLRERLGRPEASLTELLEHLVDPEAVDRIDRYFA